MASNEIGEKIYHSDERMKVTNVRITYNHITVPMEKVDSVEVNFRTEAFCFSVGALLLSLSPLLFLGAGVIPKSAALPIVFITLVLAAACAVWVYLVYNSYIELILGVSHQKITLFKACMAKNDYMSQVAKAIGDAIFDEKKYQKMKESGELQAPSPAFNPSETVRLKLMLEDYEKLKAMKDSMPKASEEKK